MKDYIDNIEGMKTKINNISPTFCISKWKQVTLYLHTGRGHSCYLPTPHEIPIEEIKENPKALHNTEFKKNIRKQMLEGKRPKECSICWEVEDLAGNLYSDRHFRAVEEWATSYIDEVKDIDPEEDIEPSYMEVSFSSVCNFKCIYCSPVVSSEWMKEIKELGDYQLTKPGEKFQNLQWFKDEKLVPVDEKDNPYIDAFWEWWPSLVKKLMIFRITGGEPLLSVHTMRLLDWLNKNPQKHLIISINSNLGVPEPAMNKFLHYAAELTKNYRLRYFTLHTSIDTFGGQAEYIRDGLNFKEFEKNIIKFFKEVPDASVSFMCTFNILSVDSFKEFLDWVLALRKEYTHEHRKIELDIPHLQSPEFLSAQILNGEYREKVESLVEYMNSKVGGENGFNKREVYKLDRILEWMKKGESLMDIEHRRSNFYLYIKELDKRRGSTFLEIFPEMRNFWFECERSYENIRIKPVAE